MINSDLLDYIHELYPVLVKCSDKILEAQGFNFLIHYSKGR